MRTKFLLWAAALLAFGGCLAGAFVFDDFALLTDPAVTSPSGWWESWRLTQTRPLTWMTFWLNYQLGGENPIGYHAVNLALHLAVVLLVGDVLRRLIPERAAWVAAAIFSVHPILTEPVSYVFARGILLATLFSLLAIRSWAGDRPWAAAGWFAVAMLAKEEVAALPVFFVLLDYSRGKRPKFAAVGAMVAVAVAMGVRVIWALAVTPGALAGSQAGITPLAYLGTQGPVMLRYLRMVLIPWGFSADPQIEVPGLGVALLSWAAIAALAVAASRWFRNLGPGFWFLAALVLLGPSSTIFPASDLAADRRMYLPMVALCAGAGLLIQTFDRRGVIGGLTVLAGLSMFYTGLWKDPEALWRQAVRQGPGKLRPKLQLARSVEPREAWDVLKEAERIAPEDPAVATEQGRVLLALGRPAEALGAFGRALALNPGDARGINNRGTALAALGQMDAARGDFQRALGVDACLFDARVNLLRLGVQTLVPSQCYFTPRQRAELGSAP